MCHSRAKSKGFLLILFTIFSIVGVAQTGTVSDPLAGRENNPYSKYGIGELLNGNTTELKGMGNITSAFQSSTELNPGNPASYSFLQRTTFEGGALASTNVISSSNLSYTTGSITPAYLMIGMPVGKNGGLCFGLRPYSHTYYRLVDTLFNSPIGNIERDYKGSGGLNYAYIGYAHRYRGLSVGFNVGYIFGTLLNTTSVNPIYDTVQAYTSEYANYTGIGGLNWKLGFMYEHKLHDSDYLLRIGGTFTLSQSLFETLNTYQSSIYYFGDTTVNDTTYNPGQLKGKLKLPSSYSIGIMLTKTDLWGIGIDYTATQWNTFNSAPNTDMNLNITTQSSKFSVGGEYSPIPVKIHKHFSRITYRLGAYYGNDYLKIGTTDLPNYGVTFGGSLHFKPTHFSWVNLHTAFDIGRLGTTQNNLIQQTYVRWSLGISFNDKWFIPRKYD